MRKEFITDYYIKGFLENTLKEQDRLDFEEELDKNPMLKDVIEGLKPLSSLEIDMHIKDLQRSLYSSMDQARNKKKPLLPIKNMVLIIIIMGILFFLAIIVFYFILFFE